MKFELFLEGEPDLPEGPIPVSNDSIRYSLANINPESLYQVEKSEQTLTGEEVKFDITMNLFHDAKFDCTLTKSRSSNAYSVFSGTVQNNAESRVVMTLQNSMLAIDIWVNDAEYQVVPIRNDIYLIEQVNLDSSPDCSSDEEVYTEQEDNTDAEDESDEDESHISVTVGILVIYEPDVVTEAGGELQLLSHITLMVENLNAALKASLGGTGSSVAIELLGPIQQNFPEMNNDNCNAKNVLKNSSVVQKWRQEYGADLVSILRTGDKLGTSCADILINKKGNVDAAYSVVSYSQARQQHSFAHEIGHNFGCPHNKENARSNGVNDGNNGIFWGYKWKHKDGTQYRTLMSYGSGTRILHFSNPNVLYKGEPTGKEDAFNASAIIKTARVISSYGSKTETDMVTTES